jgi:hypothetical protein
MTWLAMLAGAQAPGRTNNAREAKGRGQTKCSPWSSRLVVGRGANNPTPEKFARDPHRDIAPEKKQRSTLSYGFCLKN